MVFPNSYKPDIEIDKLTDSILNRISGDSFKTAPFNGSLEFKHPEDIDGTWKTDFCSDCHRYLY